MSEKAHTMVVPRCGRTGEVVEPMLTDQWFVAMTKPAPASHPLRSQASRSRTCASRRSATACPCGRAGRRREGLVRSRRVAVDVPALDQQHPGLVHLAAALVGPPDPGLVRRGGQHLRRAEPRTTRWRRRARSSAAIPRRSAATKTSSTPGSARRCGVTRRSAGRPTRASSGRSSRRRCSLRASTSSSSGSRG